MAKTLVQKEICDACGAEVRPGSIFCYNCGGAVADEPSEPKRGNNNQTRNAVFQKDLNENANQKTADIDLKTTKLTEETIGHIDIQPIAKPIEKPFDEPIPKSAFEKIEDETEEKPALTQDGAKLKSAATMRRKAKSFQRKTVEVVWEEPETAPNKWFPIVAIVLLLLVAGIIYLAMYLK